MIGTSFALNDSGPFESVKWLVQGKGNKKKKQRRSKKWNLEREEKLSEEIRNEAEIDGIPKVRRRRDSSENRVQERIVAAVNGRVPEDE